MRTLSTVCCLALLFLVGCSSTADRPNSGRPNAGPGPSHNYGSTGTNDASGNDWHDAARRNSTTASDPRFEPTWSGKTE